MATTMLRMMRLMGLAVVLGISGCATVIHGQRQTIAFESSPPGATVTILPEGVTLQTPSEAALLRKKVHTVRVALDGYCSETLYIDRVASAATNGNIVLIGLGVVGALIGTTVDTENGAAFALEPEAVSITLRPATDGLACSTPVCR